MADVKASGYELSTNKPPSYNDSDPEKGSTRDASGGETTILVDGPLDESEGSVKRVLKQRHMTMIALGGSIGTGLFVGSGSALATGGPVGCWLAYICMSAMVYAMVVALGEMATLFPVSGAFTHYAARFCDPAMGFALGINYWYSWAITIPVEVVAAAILVSYWDVSQHQDRLSPFAPTTHTRRTPMPLFT